MKTTRINNDICCTRQKDPDAGTPALERQIDQMGYKPYGLTEEIKKGIEYSAVEKIWYNYLVSCFLMSQSSRYLPVGQWLWNHRKIQPRGCGPWPLFLSFGGKMVVT